jgi:hypothetical protein
VQQACGCAGVHGAHVCFRKHYDKTKNNSLHVKVKQLQ